MYEEYTVEERCRKILEDNGGAIADKARAILLEDPYLRNLRPALEFISKSWRDPLTPASMRLSCEAVGGRSDETHEAALALSLMNLSFYVWDDLIDKSSHKLFKPTFFGKFGGGPALITGGLASAKAFSILNEMEIDREKRHTVNRLFWNLWTKMADAETIILRSRNEGKLTARKKFWKIKTEAIDLENCLKIGAVIGNGSETEITHLGAYGRCLGIILELQKDFQVSVNLTLELSAKIRSRTLPYSLLWVKERSEKVRQKIDNLANTNVIKRSVIKEIVEDILEAKAFDNTLEIIRRFTEKARKELIGLKKNEATRTLQLFIAAQPSLFIESLSALQAYES
jgi:geranylgeranyl pyrophosphate synthase